MREALAQPHSDGLLSVINSYNSLLWYFLISKQSVHQMPQSLPSSVEVKKKKWVLL